MRQYLVAGNWKMNGNGADNAALLDGICAGRADVAAVELLVCPPAPYLATVADRVANHGIAVGAQTVSEHPSGAYTGEVSATMLADTGCTYVIVGHSERRALYGETDAQVAAKFVAAADAGLTPVLCVGETLEERERGETQAVVGRQLDAVVSAAGAGRLDGAVLAYEPVWAIGTGQTATPAQAQEVHAFLRGRLETIEPALAAQMRILYGGSMKPANAGELLAGEDIDGGLIGGASLVADSFLAIAAAAAAASGD